MKAYKIFSTRIKVHIFFKRIEKEEAKAPKKNSLYRLK